jgi:hypothetical protein
MKTSVRPSTPDDAPRIAALLAAVFGLGPTASVVEPRHMNWKYWQERGDWTGSRSFVLTRGDEILAHAGIVPGSYAWGSTRFGLVHLIDWAARPGFPGAGVALLRRLDRLADVQLAVGGSQQTLALLPSLGYRAHGTATQFVRALRPRGALQSAADLGRKALPRVVAEGLVASLTARSRRGAGWSARRISAEELAAASLPLPTPTATMAVLERSVSLFEHVLGCPVADMSLYAVERDREARGYFLLAVASDRARLADCWLDTSDPADWRALVELAVQAAKIDGKAGRLIAAASDPVLTTCLAESGFVTGREDVVQLLCLNGRQLPTATLRVQMLDNDFAWL